MIKLISLVLCTLVFTGTSNTTLPQVQNYDFCSLYGSVYVEEDRSRADFFVYIEESEAFADLIVYEEEHKLFADRQGLWHFADSRNFANFTIYFVKDRTYADFSIHYTEAIAFAGCNN